MENYRNIGAESFNGNIENYATSEQQKKLLDAVKLMEDIAAGEEDGTIKNPENSEVDERGFRADGINVNTGTIYDEEGYDIDGFDEIGVDREGFDRDGFGSDGRDREGYDENGFNEDGFDRNGFDFEGYDAAGYDVYGFDRDGVDGKEIYDRVEKRYGQEVAVNYRGFDSDGKCFVGWRTQNFDREGYDFDGYDKDGFNKIGVDRFGFDRDGINLETGRKIDRAGFFANGLNAKGETRDGFKLDEESGKWLDEEGYDRNGRDVFGYNRKGFDPFGYDKDGFNKYGYNVDGYDREGYSRSGYNRQGYDRNGANRRGFNKQHLYAETGEIYDPEGFDYKGFNADGVDRDGFNAEGYDADGYNRGGYNRDGYNREGYDKYGYDEEGYNADGYDRRGLDREGFNRFGFDAEGFGRDGFNKSGKDRDGFNRKGVNELGIDRFGFNRDGINVVTGTERDEQGFNKFGLDKSGYDRDGKLDESVKFALFYIEKNGIPMSDFAKEKGMSANQARSIIYHAKEKVPDLTPRIDEMVDKAQSKKYAAVRGSIEHDIEEQMSPEDFWKKHPRLDIQAMAKIAGYDTMLKFVESNIALISPQNESSIHDLTHIFCSGKPDAKKTLDGIDYVKKIVQAEKVEGEEAKKNKIERVKRLNAMRDFVKPHMKFNLRDLRDGTVAMIVKGDEGEIRHQVTDKDVNLAIQTLNKNHQLVSRKTVMAEIRKNIK